MPGGDGARLPVGVPLGNLGIISGVNYLLHCAGSRVASAPIADDGLGVVRLAVSLSSESIPTKL